jgi:hypothetical protein
MMYHIYHFIKLHQPDHEISRQRWIHRYDSQVSFYTRVTFLKMSRKSNTEFPFKIVYFLGVRGLISSLPLVDIQTCTAYMYCMYTTYTFLYSIHTLLYNMFIYC